MEFRSTVESLFHPAGAANRSPFASNPSVHEHSKLTAGAPNVPRAQTAVGVLSLDASTPLWVLAQCLTDLFGAVQRRYSPEGISRPSVGLPAAVSRRSVLETWGKQGPSRFVFLV